jgi:hypothetical protein
LTDLAGFGVVLRRVSGNPDLLNIGRMRYRLLCVITVPGAENAVMKTSHRQAQQEIWNKDGSK